MKQRAAFSEPQEGVSRQVVETIRMFVGKQENMHLSFSVKKIAQTWEKKENVLQIGKVKYINDFLEGFINQIYFLVNGCYISIIQIPVF